MTRVPPLLPPVSAETSLFKNKALLSEAGTARKTSTLGLIAEAWTATPGGADNICREARRGTRSQNLGRIISANGARDGGKICTQS